MVWYCAILLASSPDDALKQLNIAYLPIFGCVHYTRTPCASQNGWTYTMATRNDVNTTKTATPVAQTPARKISAVPSAPVASKKTVSAPKSPAALNMPTCTRHLLVATTVLQWIAENGAFPAVYENEWSDAFNRLADYVDAVLARHNMSGITGDHQLKCYIPGIVPMADIRYLWANPPKQWYMMPQTVIDLVASGYIDSGTFTDIASRIDPARYTNDAIDAIKQCNGVRADVRSTLARIARGS